MYRLTTTSGVNNIEKFVYEEVWLHELVPQHATQSAIKLNFPLQDDFETVALTHVVDTCNPCKHVHQSNTFQQQSNKSTISPLQDIIQPKVENRAAPSMKFSKNSMPSSLTNLSDKELWDRFVSSLNKRHRGRVRRSSFKVEFSEHIFSKLYNGKVQNQHGFKVKNRLIPIGQYKTKRNNGASEVNVFHSTAQK